MKLLPEIEEAWQKFEKEAREKGADVHDENSTTYTQRDPASDDWNTRGKLVRLDHVVMAAHIMAARYSFFGITKVWVKVVKKVSEFLAGLVISARVVSTVGSFFSRKALGVVVSTIIQTVSEVPLQIELESAVRTASLQVRSDIFRRFMGSKSRRRRATKLVLTRHIIPPQRRPNKLWRSPRK